jgi:hypothetical protein
MKSRRGIGVMSSHVPLSPRPASKAQAAAPSPLEVGGYYLSDVWGGIDGMS